METRTAPHRTGVIASASLILGLACASAPSAQVAVLGQQTDISRLAGDWRGHYSSVVSSRSGAIRFELEANAHDAFGEVLMLPDPLPDPEAEVGERPVRSQRLRIRFVTVKGATITGVTEPYDDPECGCLVSTAFTGELTGDRIEGTYISRGGPMHFGHLGAWTAERSFPEAASQTAGSQSAEKGKN